MKARIRQLLQYYLWAFIALLLSLLCTFALYFYLQYKRHQRNEQLFEAKASHARERINRRLDHYIQILRGAKGLMVYSERISRQDWRNYIEALEVAKTFPGIQGIGFAEVIRPAELAAHERRIRSEGFPGYGVHPAGVRDLYSAIVFLEPFRGRNLRAFGYDMLSEPVRRQAMIRARDSGQPVMTGKVRLVQETNQGVQPGSLVYLAVYRGAVLPPSPDERRRQLQGFVYSPFRAYDLMQNLFQSYYDDINIRIYDGKSIAAGDLLYEKNQNGGREAAGSAGASDLEITQPVRFASHTWTLRFTANPDFDASGDNLPAFALAGGILISGLIFLVVWSGTKNRQVNRLKQIITDNSTAALFMVDGQGYCTFMNPAAEKMTGYSLKEIRRKPLHGMIHHHHPDGSSFPIAACPIYRALQEGRPMRMHEDTFIRKDGTFFQVRCAITPIYVQEQPLANVMEVRDITGERKARVAIEESEVRFRNMADHAPVMIWITDEAEEAVYFNRQWLAFTGQSAEQALGRGWQDQVHPEDRVRVHDIYADAVRRQVDFDMDYRLQRQDGVYRWVISSATPRRDAQGNFLGYIGSVIDITERKEAERKLKENADLLHRIFLEVPAIVALIRASDQVYILANPMYRRLHGERVLLGKSIRDANPDLQGQGFFEVISKVIRTGQPFVGKEVAVTIQNETNPYTGYFNLVFQPLATTGNQVAAVLLFAVEVTELVRSRAKLQTTNEELTRTNQELRQTNTDLDNFVYTASHDLKAPIANLEGLTHDLQHSMQGRLDADEQMLIRLLSVSINKLKRTIMDLSEITKVQKSLDAAPETMDFAEVYHDVQVDLQKMIEGSGAQIITDFAVAQVKFARKNLRSIMYNLLSNALKYRSPDREPRISVSTHAEGQFICFIVADNGLGIRNDQHHKLFAMFRRVHTHVEGSGIGLYIIKRIIENNGGRIELESEAGKGTVFKVFFPL